MQENCNLVAKGWQKNAKVLLPLMSYIWGKDAYSQWTFHPKYTHMNSMNFIIYIYVCIYIYTNMSTNRHTIYMQFTEFTIALYTHILLYKCYVIYRHNASFTSLYIL